MDGGQSCGARDILRGRCQGAQRTGSNMIRIFISSSFTDMSVERKVLLDQAYPQVLSFCRRLGLVFEVVDLSWGIRTFPYGDHEASEIVLQEIQTSQKVSAGPAFVGLLGSRYGHRPLPRLIPEKQFEVLLSKLSKNPEGVQQLQEWFQKDSNSVPPTYVLQPIAARFPHYDDLRPEVAKLHDDDLQSWQITESQLLQLLRSAAAEAETDGDITPQQKRLFYSSGEKCPPAWTCPQACLFGPGGLTFSACHPVTERALEEGVWKDNCQMSALLFVREIPRQRMKDGSKRLAKFVDLTAGGLLDAEAQELLTGLKSRLYATSKKILNLHCVELNRGSIDPKRKEHAEYLDSICQQFVSQMTTRISEAVKPAGEDGRKIWGSTEEDGEEFDWVVEEARRHAVMAAKLSKSLQGRDGLLGKICLAMWESSPVRHGPLVVHGASGMGKTVLLCKLAQEMQGVLEAKAVLVIRLLAANHPQRPNINHVVHSVCLQVCLACGLAPPPLLSVSSHLQLQRLFQNTLEKVSQQGNTLLLILDSLEQLADQHQAHRLAWLPADVPPNVHLLLSVETASEAFASMRLRPGAAGSIFEADRLSRDEGQRIVESRLQAARRTLTREQKDAVLQSFHASGSPLHLQLLLSAAEHCTSFTPPTELLLGSSSEEVMSQLLLKLEEKHGKELVGGALGCIVLARRGLMEAELRDVMSLDDDIISEVYRYSLPLTPSLIRMPPLLWARLKRDLQDQLEVRWTDGVAMLAFSSRLLSEVVKARYLTPERRERTHRILAEYFLGRWSGRLKPAALPGLTLLLSDRKVPPQPLWFAPGLANVRKLQELPHHLLHGGLWEELRQEVVGSAEWLYCQIRVCGVSSLISDLDQCSQYMSCCETGLVRETLVLMKPSLDVLSGHMERSVFYSELLARLSSLASTSCTVIGRICSQCHDWLQTCPEPVLIPRSSFLQQPGGALQHTLTAPHRGVLCLAVGAALRLLVTGSADGVVAVWSLLDKHLLQVLQGPSAAILSVKIIESSAHCLSLAADGSLRRWSLKSGQQLFCIQEAGPAGSAPSSAHLQVSDQLLFVHTWMQVKVWTSDGTEIHSEDGSLVLGVLGDFVVSLLDLDRVRIFDPVTGSQTTVRLTRSLSPVISVTSPKRGSLFVVSEDGFLHQICRTGQQTVAEFPELPSLFSASEDEKILIAGWERTLSLFRVCSDSADRFLELQHDDEVLSACVSLDGRRVVTGAADQLIRVWSVTSGRLVDTLCGCSAPVTSLLLDGHWAVSASSAADSVQLWSLTYDRSHKPLPHIPAGSAHSAVTRDGDQVFYVRHQNQREVLSWNKRTGSVSERLPVSAEVSCLELAQQKRLLLCGLRSGTVLIYPLASPQDTLCIPPPEGLDPVLCLALGSQDGLLAVAHRDALRLFQIGSRDGFPAVEGPLATAALPPLHGPPAHMALLPGRRLLYGTAGGEVRLHDFGLGVATDLQPHSSGVTCVTASNWGTHVLVGSQDATLRLWALDPLDPLALDPLDPLALDPLDHTMEYQGVLCAAFADSDRFVFTGSQDRTVKVWDVASGKLLCVQFVYSPLVRMLTFRNGFVGLTLQGRVVQEAFRCPDRVDPDHDPLRNIKARYRVTSREKGGTDRRTCRSDPQDFNPAQISLNLLSMLSRKRSSACVLL
ncbi:LOW QUALITY PROTEIN: NACHT domain- and WD repeat-containing protein 1 [Poeciliopsis prolifica]|uniref:LOW QUALITY PROTEIN: NACHT domain- and WD repeat-containing protein 1 n=1 Tax=Poeciliopsis prolifica TaxID=188132 RepID=UPI002413B8CA|nr:LOW QUALITY PROTEIN: NACHT domain- and WD repeat-containing protein 1 [Poeciliopsis prolifica]